MTITIPELAPSLNGSRGLMRMHWATYQKIRDRWTYLVKAKWTLAELSHAASRQDARPVSQVFMAVRFTEDPNEVRWMLR